MSAGCEEGQAPGTIPRASSFEKLHCVVSTKWTGLGFEGRLTLIIKATPQPRAQSPREMLSDVSVFRQE